MVEIVLPDLSAAQQAKPYKPMNT